MDGRIGRDTDAQERVPPVPETEKLSRGEGRVPARRAAETGLYGGKIQGRNNEEYSVKSRLGTQFLHSGPVSRCP